jgi:hypothetical protein
LESFYLIYSVLYLFYSDYNLAGFHIGTIDISGTYNQA